MPNGGKKWVKPGELLPPTACTIFGSAKGANEKGKRNVNGNDKDEKYIPPEDDDVDDETSWSQSDEIAAALRLALVESTPEPSTQPPPAALEVTRSGGSWSTPDLAAPQPLPIQPLTTHPPPTQPQSSQPSTSPHTVRSSVASAPALEVPSHVRGVMRGKNATKLRRHVRHNIPVSIPISSHRPEGEHAPSLVNHLRLAIREVAPVRPHGWKKLDSGIKIAVITAVKQFFDIGDYEGDMQLQADIDRQCGVFAGNHQPGRRNRKKLKRVEPSCHIIIPAAPAALYSLQSSLHPPEPTKKEKMEGSRSKRNVLPGRGRIQRQIFACIFRKLKLIARSIIQFILRER
ncbi:hypothetical protein AAC387_Pa04g2578 [Persea americana]